MEKHGIAVELLSDPEHRVMEAYGAWGQKKMYGKNYYGAIRRTVLIDPKGAVNQTWPKANGHAVEVLEALKELVA